MLSVDHLGQTLLYCLQMSVSYFLMLVFMTFNYWLCLAIMMGIAIGHFLFGVKQEKNETNETTDCSH